MEQGNARPGAESPRLVARARGPLACFTTPEFKTERASYPVMTPSAARGVLEAVLWKPAIRWRIERIRVLSPIKFTSIYRNEVKSKAGAPSARALESGAAVEMEPYFADEDRTQRNTLALKDVDYVIEARFFMTPKAGPGDNVNKFVDMFSRRLVAGQHFHHPYLGCREFVADVAPADNAPPPIDETRDLGTMLWDIAYGARNIPIFFKARLERGVMIVPRDPGGQA
jgi:CRISPR-associated protein Cas5d